MLTLDYRLQAPSPICSNVQRCTVSVVFIVVGVAGGTGRSRLAQASMSALVQLTYFILLGGKLFIINFE